MGSGFFVSSRQRKRTRFCSFYRAGRIKGGLPCGGRKGVARSEPNLLSPSTELERRGATSGSRFEGHEVIGFVPAAGGFRSLRRSAQRAEASGCGHEPDDFVPFEARPARRASPFELRGRAQKVRFTPRYPLPSPAGETSFYPASAIKGAKPRPLSLS